MKKLLISAIILILLLAGLMLLNAEPELPYTHSFTKAICTEDNYCQDYEIMCKGKKTISMIPITGAAVQFSENWEDPRDEEFRNKMC
jgi:hypothetical protein